MEYMDAVNEYNFYSNLYNYNWYDCVKPYTVEEFVKFCRIPYEPIENNPPRPDVAAIQRNAKYTSYDSCFRLKSMGFKGKGYAYWTYNKYNNNYYIINSQTLVSNEQCIENEAVIPYYFYDYLKFIYEYNNKAV